MKIAILNATCLSSMFIYYLDKNPEVEKIFTYELPQYMLTSKKIINETDKDLIQFIDYLMEQQVDLIVPVFFNYQITKEFNVYSHKIKAPILMPTYDLCWLEWSKVKSKQFFTELNIPTSKYEIIPYDDVLKNFKVYDRPYVLKYNEEYRQGLQTVVIDDNNLDLEYNKFLDDGLKKIYSLTESHNDQFVKEEFINGIEYSYHVLSNGDDCIFIGSSRDYKKRYENDIGHNTMGMGSYSPVDYSNHIALDYAKKIVKYFKNIGRPYIGILYLGMMIDENGNHLLLEVNTRFGSPEFISILPTIDDNIIELFKNAVNGKELYPISFNDKKTLVIRLIHKNYGLSKKLDIKKPIFKNVPSNITILNDDNSRFMNTTNSLVCSADTLKKCADILYNYLETQDLGDFTYRKDLGYFT